MRSYEVRGRTGRAVRRKRRRGRTQRAAIGSRYDMLEIQSEIYRERERERERTRARARERERDS